MAKHSSPGISEAEVESLSLDALNVLIVRAKYGWENGGTSQARRAFFKRLVWLEAQRERLHGLVAKKRRYNRA
jgi:hypothetical protein